MLSWIISNMANIIVCLILLAVCAAIIFHMVKNKLQGKTSCGHDCCSCSSCGTHKPSKASK